MARRRSSKAGGYSELRRQVTPQPAPAYKPKPATPKPAPAPPPRSWTTPYGPVLKKVAGAALSAISPALGAAVSAAPSLPAGFQEAVQTLDPLKTIAQAALTAISPALGAAIAAPPAPSLPATGFGQVDPFRTAVQAGLTSVSPALGAAFGSAFPPFQQPQPRQPQRRQNVPIVFEGEAGWPGQAMRPEDYMYQGIAHMAQGPNYPPAGPATPPGYTFPTLAEPEPYIPPATPYTPPGGGGGYVPPGGGGVTPQPEPEPEVPEAPSWWGADVFGEGWVYLPTVPGETPTQWQGGEGEERPVGPGWYFLPSVRHFNQLPPMWRDWLGNVMQSQQANWPDPAIAPVQWMPSAQTFPRAPLYMWEPLAGGTPGGQHAIQPGGVPYAPPQQTYLPPPVSEPWPAEQEDRGDLVIAW